MIRSLVLLLALLAGCAGNPLTGDPMDRPGTWTPTGANETNLRAMIAEPQDLLAGAGAPNSLAAEALPPIALLLSGKRAPLPDEPTSQLGGSSSGGSGGGAAQGGGNAGTQ